MKADRIRLAARPSRDEDGSLYERMWGSWWYRFASSVSQAEVEGIPTFIVYLTRLHVQI